MCNERTYSTNAACIRARKSGNARTHNEVGVDEAVGGEEEEGEEDDEDEEDRD